MCENFFYIGSVTYLIGECIFYIFIYKYIQFSYYNIANCPISTVNIESFNGRRLLTTPIMAKIANFCAGEGLKPKPQLVRILLRHNFLFLLHLQKSAPVCCYWLPI
jgi:hypothetical protein